MFLVGVYGFIFTSFVVSIVLLKLQRKKMFDAAETFYKYAEWMVRVNIFFYGKRIGSWELGWRGNFTKSFYSYILVFYLLGSSPI